MSFCSAATSLLFTHRKSLVGTLAKLFFFLWVTYMPRGVPPPICFKLSCETHCCTSCYAWCPWHSSDTGVRSSSLTAKHSNLIQISGLKEMLYVYHCPMYLILLPWLYFWFVAELSDDGTQILQWNWHRQFLDLVSVSIFASHQNAQENVSRCAFI